MPRKARPDYFVATTSGVFRVEGKNQHFKRGQTIVHRDSPLYRAHPHLFAPVDRPAVEQATSAPGERR
ncbi:MAG TPA: hypothetical protein VK845_12975 [Gemmatimonadales bacterium]|nr:hypothetical protein [Gemmatimonadales bacterium]